jgi:hypothetical protein
VALAAAAAALAAGPALAKSYQVSGQQLVDSPTATTALMTGGLLGTMRVTSFKTLAKSPLIRSQGTERFVGCIDVARDGGCAGDPAGSLRLRFLYWARAGSKPNSIRWGSCWHPIVSGTGAFKGATGVLTMVDTPTGDGTTTQTDYVGNVTLGGTTGSAQAGTATAARCGAI